MPVLPSPVVPRDRFGYRPGLCPEAESHYERALSIPCYPGLTEAEQDRVIEALGELVAS